MSPTNNKVTCSERKSYFFIFLNAYDQPAQVSVATTPKKSSNDKKSEHRITIEG